MQHDNAMDQKTVNVIKGLVMDGTRAANSGHPGGPCPRPTFATVLFSEFLNFDPDDAPLVQPRPLRALGGHESMLLYSLLHLAGFLGLDDLKASGNWTAGPRATPKHDLTPGVEATTGPLGQGLAMAVGMATARPNLAAAWVPTPWTTHLRPGLGRGDLQEAVALGAASLAGCGAGQAHRALRLQQDPLAGPTNRADLHRLRQALPGLLLAGH
jgi:transketolase